MSSQGVLGGWCLLSRGDGTVNIVGIQMKIIEIFGHSKKAHRRYDLTLKMRNLNTEQVESVKRALREASISLLPEKSVWEK